MRERRELQAYFLQGHYVGIKRPLTTTSSYKEGELGIHGYQKDQRRGRSDSHKKMQTGLEDEPAHEGADSGYV